MGRATTRTGPMPGGATRPVPWSGAAVANALWCLPQWRHALAKTPRSFEGWPREEESVRSEYPIARPSRSFSEPVCGGYRPPDAAAPGARRALGLRLPRSSPHTRACLRPHTLREHQPGRAAGPAPRDRRAQTPGGTSCLPARRSCLPGGAESPPPPLLLVLLLGDARDAARLAPSARGPALDLSPSPARSPTGRRRRPPSSFSVWPRRTPGGATAASRAS